MTYVYGCAAHPSIRTEVIHSMREDPVILCPECSHPMHRIPQAVRFYINPADVLYDKLDRKYREFRGRKKANHGAN